MEAPSSLDHPGWPLVWLGGFVLSSLATILAVPVVLNTLLEPGSMLGMAAGAHSIGETVSFASAGLSIAAIGVLQVPMWLTQLAAVLVGSDVMGRGVVESFRLRFAPADLAWGAAGGFGAQLLLVIAYQIIFIFIEDGDLSEPARALTERASGGPAEVIVLVLIVVIMAPLIEELFYRGLLMRGLDTHLGETWSTIASSLIFAAVHFQLLQLPGLAIAGFVFAFLVRRTGRLGTAIVGHMVFNGITVASLLSAV